MQFAANYNGIMDNAENKKAEEKTQFKPGELYNQTFEQIMLGLLHGLTLHNGNLGKVTREEILDVADVAPVTYDTYFKTPEKVMRDICTDIKKIVAQIDAKKEMYYEIAVIRNLLDDLSKEPLKLRIILIADERRVWENSLKKIVQYVATSWNELDEKMWEDLFVAFCFQFQSVLQKWMGMEFAAEARTSMVTQIMAWMDADARFAYLVSETDPGPEPLPEELEPDKRDEVVFQVRSVVH